MHFAFTDEANRRMLQPFALRGRESPYEFGPEALEQVAAYYELDLHEWICYVEAY